MIDRSASLRAIVTGRGNSADFTDGARKCHKRLCHRRMRIAAKTEVRRQEEDMREAAEYPWWDRYNPYKYDPDTDVGDESELEKDPHQLRLARRRARYHERKVDRQVEQYRLLASQLRKLNEKLDSDSRDRLMSTGDLLLLLPLVPWKPIDWPL